MSERPRSSFDRTPTRAPHRGRRIRPRRPRTIELEQGHSGGFGAGPTFEGPAHRYVDSAEHRANSEGYEVAWDISEIEAENSTTISLVAQVGHDLTTSSFEADFWFEVRLAARKAVDGLRIQFRACGMM